MEIIGLLSIEQAEGQGLPQKAEQTEIKDPAL